MKHLNDLVPIFLCLTVVSSVTTSSSPALNVINDGNISYTAFEEVGIQIAGWHWDKLSNHIFVSIFIVAICMMKIAYHHAPPQCKFFTRSIPESNVLIIVGLIAGIIVYFLIGSAHKTLHWSLSPELFFFILLPPIMLEAAYSLYDINFINNLSTIIYFAVIGTVLNSLIIGFSLYGIGLTPAMGEPQLNLTLDDTLLFSSILVAVDPVAVLAIFSEIGVHADLHYIVFGESLFNDAVTVVLYNIFNVFTHIETKSYTDVLLGIASFFSVSCGGLTIGSFVGAFCSYITKFTRKTQILEPMMIFTTALLSYYLADLVGWSGIMSIIGCGLVQAAFCFENISKKSKTTVKYFSKVLASVSEGIIFLYLGLELVTNSHYWHWGFALWSLTLCIAARFLIVFVSSMVWNFARGEKATTYGEMFIIAFGGLRGAVAFALAATLNKEELAKCGVEKDLYVTTSLFIIMFTCFVMGVLMKPAVKLMKIDMIQNKHQLSVFYEFNDHVIDHIGTAIDDIIGVKGNNYFWMKISKFCEKYIRPCLQHKVHHQGKNIIDIYHKVALQIHLAKMENPSGDGEEDYAQKMEKFIKNKFDESSGSPEELQILTPPSFILTDTNEKSTVISFEGNDERKRKQSIKDLRATMRAITWATPSRRVSCMSIQGRISRTQANDFEEDNLDVSENIIDA